jgi:hypothetical protein
MKWVKKGLIIEPGKFDWMVSHAHNPFTQKLPSDIYQVHFAGRDKLGRAHGGYVKIDINNPANILYMTKKPTLDLGDVGCFDDCGVMPSCIVHHNGKKYMYYTGWTQQKVTPFSFFIGLAISRDGRKTYERYSKAPIFGRTYHDPYLTASPWVIIENGVWRMWYVSGTGWKIEQGNVKHYYHIKYAESKDGINWNSQGIICIDYKNSDEYAIARPVVFKENNIYKMWYCYRGGSDAYRAGYAESIDGITWIRKDDEVGIDVSDSGWDSEMICYPCVFEHEGRKYMLYNGNGYGKTGCGYAILNK